MSSAASRPEPLRAALFVAALTLWRVVTLAFDRTELWVDEAQYWLWSQNLAWGYFSKPPLIAFWLRAVTDLAGSDAPFWIRVSGPLLHGLTAGLVGLAAARLYDARTGAWAAVLYVSLPFVSLGSFLFSTDTVMLPCFALGLLAWAHLRVTRSTAWALVLGSAIGLGLLGKYAAIYLPAMLALAALLVPSARIAWRDAGVAAVLALAAVAPNLLWNIRNGGTTFRHVAEDNARLGEVTVDPGAAAGFLASQAVVFGPLLLAALFAAPLTRRMDGEARALLALSLPVILLMAVQAARAGANANWAVTAYVAGTVLAVAVLARMAWALWLSLGLNLVLALALPLAYMSGDWLKLPNGRLVAARYVGPGALTAAAASTARAEGLDTIVAARRGVTADLFHRLRDEEFALHAPPPEGAPHNYYEQVFPLPGGVTGHVLLVSADPRPCPEAREVGTHAPDTGLYRGERFTFWRTPAACLRP